MNELKIKHMVCDRCIMAVTGAAREAGLNVDSVSLGSVVLNEEPSGRQREAFAGRLSELGFELAQTPVERVVEGIKNHLIQYLGELEQAEEMQRISEYLSRRLHYNYTYLSKVFSESEGQTIEDYFIRLKIERVKEWLGYGELTLTQMAWKLNYSSVQYLSNQFKKHTGMTVTQYRESLQEHPDRISLDSVG